MVPRSTIRNNTAKLFTVCQKVMTSNLVDSLIRSYCKNKIGWKPFWYASWFLEIQVSPSWKRIWILQLLLVYSKWMSFFNSSVTGGSPSQTQCRVPFLTRRKEVFGNKKIWLAALCRRCQFAKESQLSKHESKRFLQSVLLTQSKMRVCQSWHFWQCNFGTGSWNFWIWGGNGKCKSLESLLQKLKSKS